MAIVKQLILASTSPFRQKLLSSTGLSFVCEGAKIDEKAIMNPDARELARQRSTAKATDVAARHPGCLVIGGDQTLAQGGVLFTKAADRREAAATLAKLAGKTHLLHSAFTLAYARQTGEQALVLAEVVVDTAMPMRPLSPPQIDAYLQTDEWQGCVGCYQFEHRGIHLFQHSVTPDYSAVIGLPLAALLAELRKLGIDGLTQTSAPWSLCLGDDALTRA